jgi:hypothetical protein
MIQPELDRRKKPGLWEGCHLDEHGQSSCLLDNPLDCWEWRHWQGNGGTHKFLIVEVYSKCKKWVLGESDYEHPNSNSEMSNFVQDF